MEYSPFRQDAAARPASAAAASDARPGSLSAIIARIEDAVDEETAAIRTDIRFDLKASNARKSRYLYELTRAIKANGSEIHGSERTGIARLRDKLARNEAAILAHLNAVNEVAALIQNAIRRSEADGTYSEGEFGFARASYG